MSKQYCGKTLEALAETVEHYKSEGYELFNDNFTAPMAGSNPSADMRLDCGQDEPLYCYVTVWKSPRDGNIYAEEY